MHNEIDNKDIYLDLSNFSNMEINDIISYLKDNPEKKIPLKYAEASGFFELSEEIKEVGEEDIAIKLLELYYNSVKEAMKESLMDIYPDANAIYAYGMHLLGGKVTPACELSEEMKHLFVRLCMTGMAMYVEEIDEILEIYPQFEMMLDIVPEFAYADDNGIYPQLLCNIGLAYQRGSKKIKQDKAKAFEFFVAGAELDYENSYSLWSRAKAADCAFEAAVCLMKGIGVEKNLDEALEFFKLGARGYGERVVPAMADIYLDPDFAWEDYFEDEEDRLLASLFAFNTRVRNFDGSYMKPATHYTEVDWDYYFDDYDEEEKEKQHKLLIAGIENLALTGSANAAAHLAYAYREGVLVDKDAEREKYFSEMKAFWLGKPCSKDDEDEESKQIIEKERIRSNV